MTTLALSFNEVKFSPIQRDNQIWLTGSELASALGYARVDSLNKVYERNSDEFDHNMTQVIDITENVNLTSSNLVSKIRIFSLRGCHAIGFFAKTSVAKQFRKWVLDILDKEVGQSVAKTHKSERTPLHEAHAMLVAKTKHLNSSDAWKLINQRFGTKSIDEIPYDAIPVAVEYVHHLIALYSNADKRQPSEDYLQNVHVLATHMIWVREWWNEYGAAIKKFNPTVYGRVVQRFTDGSSLAWRLVKPDQKNELEKSVKNFNWLTGTY